jgi:streptogramin lyase
MRAVVLVLSLLASALVLGCGSEAAEENGEPASAASGQVSALAVFADLGDDLSWIGVAEVQGRLWVATAADGRLREVDPRSLSSLDDGVTVGQALLGPVAGHGALWVVDQGGPRVVRFDAANRSLAFTSLDHVYTPSLAAGDDEIWLTRGDLERPAGTVLRLDPRTGRPLGKPVELDFRPSSIAASDDELWVADQPGRAVRRLDPQTGEPTGEAVQLPQFPFELRLATGRLWVTVDDARTEDDEGAAFQIDTDRAKVLTRTPLPGSPRGLATSPDSVWVATREAAIDWASGRAKRVAGRLVRLDLATGRPAGPPLQVGANPGNVVAAGGAVYVTDIAEHSLRRIDP